MLKRLRGFTLVELIVVVTIIGILASITILAYTVQQRQSRDAERLSQATVIAEALEKYYDKNGEYPGCAALTGTASSVSSNILIGIDQSALVAPQAAIGTTNSLQCNDLTAVSQPDFFAYVGDGSSNCLTGNACLSFQLKYRDETNGQIDVIQSRRITDISTSGIPQLTAAAAGFTQANTSWTAVPNSISYTIQQATDNAFTQNLTSQDLTTVSSSISSLTINTTYYYRVRANSSSGAGSWSNMATVSTWNLATPSLSTSTVSSTSYKGSWNTIAYANGYVAQCSTDGATWGTNCQTGTLTATSYTFTGAAQGTPYYVRVKAVNGSYASSWSNVASATTTIDAPGAYNMNYAYMAWNNVRGSASAASCPSGTTPSYDWYYSVNGANNFWVSGTGYQVVDYSSVSVGQTVSLTVATRCITSYASSSFVWANGAATKTLASPTAWAAQPSYRVATWGGTCPDYTTAIYYNWQVHGTGSVGVQGANGVQYTSWDGSGYSWGDGNVRSAILCNGPWGQVSASSGPADFGYGCLPTITVAACTW